MNQNLLRHKLTIFALSVTLIFISLSVQTGYAQEKPLTLAQVLTGLQAKTGDFTLAEKNRFISRQILARGVTFKLSPVIQNELAQVGASSAVLRAIRLKSPRTTRPPRTTRKPPSTKLEKIWVDHDVVQRGVSGILVHTKFNIYNLKGIDTQLYVRFKNQTNQYLRSSNKKYSNKRGELAVYRTKIKPIYTATVFKDMKLFIPYKEINLSSGYHDLQVDAGVLYKTDQARILRVGQHSFTLNQPVKPTARFSKLWIKYGKKQRGKLGMIVHLRFNVSNLVNSPAQIVLGFSKRNGGKLTTKITKYRSVLGQVALYRTIRPKYVNAVFKDLKIFVPYEAFNLNAGKYTLKMHADLIYPDGSMLQHFGEKSFSYSRR